MVITTSLKDMYDFLSEQLWENADSQDPIYYGEQFRILRYLAFKDANKIRKSFVDGWTVVMVPNWDDSVNEVRIYNDDELFMVVCGKELVF